MCLFLLLFLLLSSSIFFFFLSKIYLFERKQVDEQWEGKRERILKQTSCWVWSPMPVYLTTREMMTWAKKQESNGLSHPGTPRCISIKSSLEQCRGSKVTVWRLLPVQCLSVGSTSNIGRMEIKIIEIPHHLSKYLQVTNL